MPRRDLPRYSLARGLIRMSWNKYNLYNLALRTQIPSISNRTVYQQKWFSKRETRAYHGDYLTERQFTAQFRRQLPPVIQLKDPNNASKHPNIAVLTYASLERRADFVVFRSCFASSIYQARQMVVHGHVEINDILVRSPSHMLHDGDLLRIIHPEVIPILQKPSSTSSSASESSENEDQLSKKTNVSIAQSSKAPLNFAPKPYMQPFLFVPEYLEVNYNTCSVVFVREPVSRPGRQEIPSPLPPDLHALAYEFYIKNGK